jgi:hypothetical protein
MSKILYIDYDARRSGGEALSAGPWSDREDEVIDLTVNGVNIKPVESFGESVKTLFTPKVGMDVWLVTVRYSTGDTFGRSLGNYKFITAYDNRDDAESLAREIEKNNKDDGGYKFSFIPSTPFPEDSVECSSWTGYFDRLEMVDIEQFTVRK